MDRDFFSSLLGDLFRKTFGSFATIVQVNLMHTGPYDLGVSPPMDEGELAAIAGKFLQSEGSHIVQSELYTNIYFYALPEPTTQWIEARETKVGVYGQLVSELHQLPLLAPLSVQFMGMYTLGMIVRYRPDCWIEVTQLGRNDRSLAIAKAFIAHCEESFPLEILRILADPDHRHKLAA